jgi:hypothetical protein
MNAPKRWLDDAPASSAERQLLQSGLSLEPPPDAQGQVWAALLTKIPPPGAPPPGQGGGGAAAGKGAASAGKGAVAAKAASAGVLKSALIGAGSAVALIAGYSVVTPSTDRPPPPAAVAPSTQTAAPPPPAHAAPPAAAAEPSAVPSAAPSADPVVERRAAVEPRAAASSLPSAAVSATPAAVAEAERETMTREESRLVAEARDALRKGDAAGALTMLEQIRVRFPSGVLGQEREALAIEALARSGRKAEAAARASAFVKAYPSSPLASRVQGFAN